MNKKKEIPLTIQAYNILKKRIMDLNLRPGEIIMVQTLAKELGISRTPVREAVVRLEKEGFVEAAEGKKFRVSTLSLKDVLEIHELRKLMEVHAAKNVAKSANNKQIKELESTIAKMGKALADKSHDRFFEYDLAFHKKIISYHGNDTLILFMNQINDKIQRIRYLAVYVDQRLEKTIEEHQAVIDAIKNRDPDRVAETLEFHLEKIEEVLAHLFDKKHPHFISRFLI